ncbi:fumarylacetoacetate hydrolase family protein [Sphingomonas sp. C8-2]|jgi:2-keto-4-pentenoate hydratase/2-oxohepta-3-ene-1,7-dioic acid hydratase in catechol pathway|nr:fumarylacetoacetate hydrolase family protein [Sphingomonas sp. C8-2]
MSEAYRLATVEGDGGSRVVVERKGLAVPLTALLEPDDLARLGGAPKDLMPLLEEWPHWSARLAERMAGKADRFGDAAIPADRLGFLPPIALPRKLICIGANYHDHIAEMPIPIVPTYPYSFLMSPSTTLRGSGAAVEKPSMTRMMDWEAELAVVIGLRCRDVPEESALTVVAGYTNFNDLSARDWIASRPPIGVDWVQHKNFDGFGPIGPYFEPAEFTGDPQALPVRLSVNGVTKQDSSTAQMVFGVAAVIAHLSRIMTLEPGDIIATGTPAGVGHGRQPPEYLQPGDEVRMEIGNLGELVTPIV